MQERARAGRCLALVTNVPTESAPQVQHTYRFDQEDGLDVEDIWVHTMQRMSRLAVLTLLARSFVPSRHV
jgi:hypothetical protein